MKASIIAPGNNGIPRKDVPNLSIFAHYMDKADTYDKYIALSEHKGEWLCLDFDGNVKWTPGESKVYVVGKLELEK